MYILNKSKNKYKQLTKPIMKKNTMNQRIFYKQLLAFMIAALISFHVFPQAPLTPVTTFGSNPGNLRMYSYVPTGISGSVSLVVVLHGCTQTATSYAAATGWNKLADKHKFILLYPEQKKENNVVLCFNWFDSLYQKKDQLQVLSIKQMVDYMKSNYSIDPEKIFITGLSAGGGMSNTMLANYPETFKKGAIMSGIPFKASLDTLGSYYSTHGFITKTPAQWGNLVKKANPTYTGEFPDVALFHGGKDSTVYLSTNTESVKQWTNVNGADQTPESVDTAFQGNNGVSLSIYNDSLNKPVVYSYIVKTMKHAVSIDTGNCSRQGGQGQAYAKDFNFHSTYWAADFFGILKTPYSITGLTTVNQNTTNVIYSVVNTSGSVYKWTVPAGATIASGQGTNAIRVNFTTTSGNVSVTETTRDGCVNDKAFKFVKVLYFNIIVKQTGFINCYGAATGELTATVIGNTGPYTLTWLPVNKNTPVIKNLKAGNYTLIVRDGTGKVIYTNTVAVAEPALLVTNQIKTICAGQSYTVGTSTYTKTGVYTNKLTSSKGCDSTVNTTLIVRSALLCALAPMKSTSEEQNMNTEEETISENEATVAPAVNVYPNPFSTFATIQFNEVQKDVMIKIIDVSGNQILSTNFSGTQYQIDAQEWNTGNYTILIIDGKNNIITKNIMVR
jgi:poly(hydroxyalkanoate) depolymerase family esterase